MGSPVEIAIALHYWMQPHITYAAHDPAHANSPYVRDALFRFERDGLLERSDGPVAPRRTEALDAYVNALCSVGFPVKTWVVPEAKPQLTLGMRRVLEALPLDMRKGLGIQ